MIKNKKNIFKIWRSCFVIAVLSFIVIGCDRVSSNDSDNKEIDNKETAIEHAAKHVDPNYVCPMHSQITDTEPSSCPICGMDLELRETPQQSDDSNSVFISAAMVNNLGVRLEHVEKGLVAEEIYASGFVETVSNAQEENIKSKVTGRLLGTAVQTGSWVEEGDVLVRIEVASYYETVTSYVEAMRESQMTKALKLREKLVAMGVSDEVLAGEDEKDRPLSKNLEIVAPFSGEITWLIDNAKSANKDIKVGTRLVQVTAPSLAEVDLRSFSRVARGVKVGHAGTLGVAHLPGRTWPGRVTEITHNSAGFYTIIRFHVVVPYGVLEPGAYAGAYVNAGSVEDVLRVPTSAVIYDEGSTRVIRLTDDDGYEAVEITLGFEGHDWVEVVSGLELGNHVVTRGQFLIDSEATLQAGFKRLSK